MTCDCKCPPPDCCELECLVQPRFFCGQLLADQDLTAMVDWVKGKAALARYRHGWGIVCGLDVHCGKGGSVTVSPGYALDCCGHDIVLCKEDALQLKDCWQRGDDPCAPGKVIRATGANPAQPADVDFGGLKIPGNQVQAFDVFLRYSESPSDPRTALSRGGCGGEAGCENTRVQEGGELYCKPANDCVDPTRLAFEEWDREYYDGLKAIFDELAAFNAVGDERRKLARLLGYVHGHSLHTFCFVHEWLCELQNEDGDLPLNWFREAAFWIVQDWRNAHFRLDCKGCDPETGVLLARVWVWRQSVNGQEKFSTLYVDAYRPFRRLLAKDDHPAPRTSINGAPYIWQPVEDVTRALYDKGFGDVTPSQFTYNGVDDLRAQLQVSDSLYLEVDGGTVSPLWVRDRCNQRRVVSFRRELRLPPPPPPEPPPPEPPPPEPAPPGRPVPQLTRVSAPRKRSRNR